MPKREAHANVTVQEWADCWQRYYPGNRNANTIRSNDRMCAPFAREYGHRGLDEITPVIAQRWANKHRAQVRHLKLMFSKAVKAGLLDENVWDRVEVVGVKRSPRVPPTPVELGRLVSGARARGGWWCDFADCILFTAYSGLRGEEMERVTAKDVLDGGARLVVHGKRLPGQREPRRRVVAVFEPGRSALLRHVRPFGRVWRAAQGGTLTQDVRERQYKALTQECGVVGTFHGLRHYCATWLLDQGASEMDVAVQLGHRDVAGRVDPTQIRKRYGHPAVEPALARLVAVTTEGVPNVHADAGGGAGEDFASALRGARARQRGSLYAGAVQA